MVLNNSGAARVYGCLSTSFSRLERGARRRGAFSLVLDFLEAVNILNQRIPPTPRSLPEHGQSRKLKNLPPSGFL